MDAAQIAAMIADREAGTPGPWMFGTASHSYRVRRGVQKMFGVQVDFGTNEGNIPNFGTKDQAEHDARRIARVPDMEAHIIAQSAELERLRAALTEIAACLDGSPDCHTQGMGCGLEDRGITDRYDAMQYGWDEALDRVYSEHVSGALDVAYAAMKGDAS